MSLDKEEKRRDYKLEENTLSNKKPENSSKVLEVINKHALLVKAGGKVKKLHIRITSRIRPPRQEDRTDSEKMKPSSDLRPLYAAPRPSSFSPDIS